jgi:hypothetical protein
MEFTESIKCKGDVKATIEYTSGKVEVIEFSNTILVNGRSALASCLTNKTGDQFGFYINRMLFGDGGTAGGAVKRVSADRNGLFGVTRASKPVIATIDPNISTQATFVSVLTTSDANGYALNEMALQMSTGDLYSMATFPDLNKLSNMSITWLWRLNFI